jgi:uncharacterized protein
MFFDPMYLIFMIPAMVLAFWAQHKVQGNFKKYSQIPNSAGLTGAQAARQVLDAEGLYDVQIEATKGVLSDHYDPRNRTLYLSQSVYAQPSIASVAVSAHEAGHAIQHANAYAPLKMRNAIIPVVNIGSKLGFGLLILGIILGQLALGWVGVILFATTTVFALITLPVEFDASKRAKAALVKSGIVDNGVAGGVESNGVNAVLDAAAWTYIAGFLTSLLSLLYYVSLLSGGGRRN